MILSLAILTSTYKLSPIIHNYDVYTYTGDQNVCPMYVHVHETTAVNSVQYMYHLGHIIPRDVEVHFTSLGFHRRKNRNGICWWVQKEFHCSGDCQGARRDHQHGTHRSSSHIPANFCPFRVIGVIGCRSGPFHSVK